MARQKLKRQPDKPRLNPEEQHAVEKFSADVERTLGRLRTVSEQVQELLGRWEALTDGAPGLLGGNLVALVNDQVLQEQLEGLAEVAARMRGDPADIAEQADFTGGLVGEYAALLKVLAGIELEPGSALEKDWESVSDELLQHGAELQRHAEELELALEGPPDSPAENENQRQSSSAMGPRTPPPAFLHEIWEKAQSGASLEGEAARLARAMQQHPEYRVAWESTAKLGNREFTIKGVSPILHVSMHAAVEGQLEMGEPPETAATLERLTTAGMDRHEAIHRIANVLAQHIWQMEREARAFDRAAYVRALQQLK